LGRGVPHRLHLTLIHETDHQLRDFSSPAAASPEQVAKNVLGEVLAPMAELATRNPEQIRWLLSNRDNLRAMVEERLTTYSDDSVAGGSRYYMPTHGDNPVDLVTDKLYEVARSGPTADLADNLIRVLRDPRGTGMLGGIDRRGAYERQRTNQRLDLATQESLRKHGMSDEQIARAASSGEWSSETGRQAIALMESGRYSGGALAAVDADTIRALHGASTGGEVAQARGMRPDQLLAIDRHPALLERFAPVELRRLSAEQLFALGDSPNVTRTATLAQLAVADPATIVSLERLLVSLDGLRFRPTDLTGLVPGRSHRELDLLTRLTDAGVPPTLSLALGGDAVLQLAHLDGALRAGRYGDAEQRMARGLDAALPGATGQQLRDWLASRKAPPIDDGTRSWGELHVDQVPPGADRGELENARARDMLAGDGLDAGALAGLEGYEVMRLWSARFQQRTWQGAQAVVIADAVPIALADHRDTVVTLGQQIVEAKMREQLRAMGLSDGALAGVDRRGLQRMIEVQQAATAHGDGSRDAGHVEDRLRDAAGDDLAEHGASALAVARGRNTLIAAGLPADVVARLDDGAVAEVLQLRRAAALAASPEVIGHKLAELRQRPYFASIEPHLAEVMAGVDGRRDLPGMHQMREDLIALGGSREAVATLSGSVLVRLHQARVRDWSGGRSADVLEARAIATRGEQLDRVIRELAAAELDSTFERRTPAAPPAPGGGS
jgi:hypothetical protein